MFHPSVCIDKIMHLLLFSSVTVRKYLVLSFILDMRLYKPKPISAESRSMATSL
jgi:hypothetical protein